MSGGRFTEQLQQLILARYAPACVVVDARREILYSCGPIHDYLSQPTGLMHNGVLAWAADPLRGKLRAALRQAEAGEKLVRVGDIRLPRGRSPRIGGAGGAGGAVYSTELVVEPLHTPRQAEGLILITFREAQAKPAPPDAPAANATGNLTGPGASPDSVAGVSDAPPSVVSELEDELRSTREELQSTIDHFGATNEELKAANEEIVSNNEELQSTNEELETAKEELQSLNEELSTVNSQLQTKVEELETKTADLDNLLG